MGALSEFLDRFKKPVVMSDRLASLETKISTSLEKSDPKLVDLVKKISISLEKKNLLTDRAKVALCLDISGSMRGLYQSGQIDQFVQRILALGLRFDDDGEIDVFLFGEGAHRYGSLNAGNYKTFTQDMLGKFTLEGGTRYGSVIERIRDFYVSEKQFPVYVMFVTDGETGDPIESTRQIKLASNEPIFWQFLAIGSGQRAGFDFLRSMDAMEGRLVDNTSFFVVSDPSSVPDDELYEKLLMVYPDWQRAAHAKGVFTGC